MTEPVIASRAPLPVDVQEGKAYFWCRCGKSKAQPFCDGSHAGTPFEPLKWVAPESKKVFFCGCKRTGTQPLCDGKHNSL